MRFLLLCLVLAVYTPFHAMAFRLVTYNLRFDSMPDNITVQQSLANLSNPLIQPRYLSLTAEQPWSLRRIRVAEHLISEGIILAGFQEALVRQVLDLAELLGSDWDWVGVGRDDGVLAGEFSPIFYKKTDLLLISNDTFWTSNTPFEPSKFPGAGSFRICNVAHLQLKTGSGTNFTFLNTHMDDQSDAQRQLAASLILYRARFEAVNTKNPVLVIGDFNSPPTGADSGAYNIFTGAKPPVAINATFAAKYAVPSQSPAFSMLDLRAQAPRRAVRSTFATFTGFTAASDTSDWQRIDFVFGGTNGGWTADGYKVESSRTDDGVLASDHRPVFADVSL
ncbi:Endonuclease exonuclease phosphatase family protein [Mycena venus]|uniref:Endonuclease exonuclease phosphatase family protein n=1 Tax=Mycena venus TaxID=2733690 RepID=A0A8H6Z2Y8_9AGAR|nr:Endonuclease exonuclease phosphatase family protein [Mycena venus]